MDATTIHMCLNVSDADRLADWYVENLGFERSWEFTTADGTGRNVYVADGDGFELQLSDTEGENEFEQGTAWDHVAVGVGDVDAAFEAIDHHGVVKEPGDQPEAGARTAFVEDPDGHVVELVEPLEE
jgi:lactoylglutathione lyase